MRIQLQPPESWEDFEFLAWQLWKSIWADQNAQLHGRRGQPQCGVDIFGRPFHSPSLEGVQCKGKDRLTKKQIDTKELQAEISKAKEFTPKIHAFVMATTAPRDAAIQAEANRLSDLEDAPFRVAVWSWDDIVGELNFRDHLIPLLYPQFQSTISYEYGSAVFDNKLYFYRTQPVDQVYAFLSHPELHKIFSADTRGDLRNAIFEMSLNAFSHGNASKIVVDLDKNGSFDLIDDGVAYNPLASDSDPIKGVGKLFLKLFRKKYAEIFTVSYSRTTENENVLRFKFLKNTQLTIGMSAKIEVSENEAIMPARARYIAQTARIPIGQNPIELHISSMVFSPSSFYEFLDVLFRRISDDVTVRIFFGQHDILAECLPHWIDTGQLSQSPHLIEIIRSS